MVNAGFPDSEIDAARQQAANANEFEVWTENWQATRVFSRLHTQWQLTGMGELTGLNYPGMESVMRMLGVPRHRWRSLFVSLQIMEAAALDYMRNK